MAWSFSGDKPIFSQLVERITLDILTGRYAPGDRLPTVRDLAIEAGVNPNTVQHALSEAESTGLIVVKRGDGRFVTSDEETIGRIREKHVGDLADSFVSSLRSFGLSDSDVEDITRKAINSERKDLNHG